MKKEKKLISISLGLFGLILISVSIFILLGNNSKKMLFKAYAEISNNSGEYTLYFVAPNTKLDKNLTVWKYYKTDSNSVGEHVNLYPWHDLNNEITKIVIVDNISIKNTAFIFYDMPKLKKIEGLDKLNTSEVTNMAGMFNGCTNLTSLDLSRFDTSNVTSMAGMFYGCKNLHTIYVDNEKWNTLNVKYSDNMFTGATSLRGGNTTLYDENKIDKEYARIDTVATPGYFTSK